MSRRRAALGLAALLLAGCAAGPRAHPNAGAAARLAALGAAEGIASRPDHVLLIALAGLAPADYLGPEAPPTLRALAAGGAAAEWVEPVVPAAVQPALTTLVSGRTPAHHGITADRRLGERGVRTAAGWHASQVEGPTIWAAALAERAAVAALDWPATRGASIPLLLPQLAPERRGETWLALQARSATPWLYELASRAAPEAAAPGAARDAFLVDAACQLFASATPPELLLLRLSEPAAALSAHGPGSPEARAALESSDARLAALVACIDRVGRLAASAFVVSGDRIFQPVHTALRPNAVLARVGLLAPNRPWHALARSNGGSAFVYARGEKAALAARRALEAEAQRTRAFRVVPAEEMIQLSTDREAWFGLAAVPGWHFEDAAAEPREHPSRQRGASGYLDAAGSPGLVAFGRGVRRGLRLPRVRQTDVAPTVARLLGVELPKPDGRALVGALRLSPAVAGRGATP